VDDIEDNSTVRRNRECVHLLYGLDVSINAGNFMYYAPMLAVNSSKAYSPELKQELVQIYLEDIMQLHIGQAWDILWHNTDKLEGEYPTEAQYLQMTAHKTGALARLTTRMMCAYVKAPQEQREILSEFVENVGVAFQIQDDLLNLEGEEFKSTKGYNGEDIHEGKITLIVIHHLQRGSPQSKARLIDILKLKTTDPQLIQEAIDILHSTKSLDYAREVMYRLIDEAKAHLDSNFPPS
jgi:geranylgeranyl pyrophosphate synthase